MRFHPAHIDNLRKLYVDQIEHLISAEDQILEVLPKMVEAASNAELKRMLQTHLQESREQVARLEEIVQESVGRLEPKRSKPMAALIDEANELVGDAKNDPVRDVAIITAWERIEHYEIAVYSAVCNYAEIIGETEQTELLKKTLEQEKNANEALRGLAEPANTRADRAA